MSDEVASAMLNVSSQMTSQSIDIIAKLLNALVHMAEENNRVRNSQKNLTQDKVTSRNITMDGGEVQLKELVKNAKNNRDTIVPVNEGLTESDKKFVVSKAKQLNLPIAFEKKENLYYPIISGQDKEMYKHICEDMIHDKLVANEKNKTYNNFKIQDWQVPFVNEYFNKYNISAQFGKLDDGQCFCLYNKSDEAVVKIANNDFKKALEEIRSIDIKENEDFITLTDKNGHRASVVKSDLPNYRECTELIQTKFNFDETKSRLLAARMGENFLTGNEKKDFFSEDIRSQFSSIKTDCVLKGESELVKPYKCFRLKPKNNKIPNIVFMDENSNFVILQPQKMNNKKMKSLIEQNLGIDVKQINDALVSKARAVSQYYDGLENSENKNFSYDIQKSGNYSSKGIALNQTSEQKVPSKIDNKIDRISIDQFTMNIDFISDEEEITKSAPLTLSLTDKADSVENLKEVYMKQGIGEYTALQMAKECVKRAENQPAENVIQLESVKAEKFFESDVSSIKSAELELAMGDKKKIVSLNDEEKAKNDIMEAFGVDEESAEAVIESGTREMSDKQRSKLEEFGYDVDKLEIEDAEYLLDNISKNNWQVPSDLSPDKYIPKSESVRVPETAMPDAKVPDMEMPDVEMPDFSRGGM